MTLILGLIVGAVALTSFIIVMLHFRRASVQAQARIDAASARIDAAIKRTDAAQVTQIRQLAAEAVKARGK